MTDDPPVRILVVDDHALLRQGLVKVLAEERDLQVVGEAANGREAIAKAAELMPDVILMDITMPEMGGLEATRRIKQEMPYVRIIILTIADDDQSLFEAVKSGAQGYLLKNVDPPQLVNTVRRVAAGETAISRTMASKLIGEFATQPPRPVAASPTSMALTPREKEVLEQVAEGKSNRDIATALAIAENTVKNHLKNILEKLHLENRVQAAAFALRQNLFDKTGKLDKT
jgi:two-component system, NarL family, nitrate/nitrite response regulator NarL